MPGAFIKFQGSKGGRLKERGVYSNNCNMVTEIRYYNNLNDRKKRNWWYPKHRDQEC